MYIFKQIEDLTDPDLKTLREFTTAPYNAMLLDRNKTKNLIVIALFYNENPVGLGVALRESDLITHIVSVYIQKEHRSKGLGYQLMNKLEEIIVNNKKTTFILTRYPISIPNSTYFEKILKKQNWETKGTVFFGKVPNNAPINWIDKPFKHKPEFEIFKWQELKPEEREEIISKGKNNWYPPALSPFNQESDIEELNSLGLRYKGHVIGWIITHRTLPDTIQYWCLFVDPDQQRTGIGMHLLVEAFRLQKKTYPPLSYGAFGFRLERIETNRQWESFFKKRILPYCSTFFEANEAIKQLKNQT